MTMQTMCCSTITSKWALTLTLLVVALLFNPAESFTAPSRTTHVRLQTAQSVPTLPSLVSSLDVKSNHAFTLPTLAAAATRSTSTTTSTLSLSNNDSDTNDSTDNLTLFSPLDRPLLAMIDTLSLIVFAAIGKSSHSADGSLDLASIMITAFPFITSWIVTSPITSVYSPDERGENVNLISSTLVKVGKGWIVAVPLGIALRGVIKGYVPPVPFTVVTMIATLVILGGVRILFSVAEDFFVEFVN